MDLRNNHITVRELLNNPASRAVLESKFPQALRLPIVSMPGSLTLDRAIKLAAAYVPQKAIDEALEELRKL